MKKVIVDTSVMIDHLRGHSGAVRFLEQACVESELWSVTVVRTEVLAGLRRGEEERTYQFLRLFRWQEVTESLADRAGDLARRYLRFHPGIDTVDYLLAATVEQLDGLLATRNVKHFPMLRGLKIPY